MEILNLLNKKLDNKYEYLRVLSVKYDTNLNICEIWFLYPETNNDLTSNNKTEIADCITQELKATCKFVIKFKKSFLNESIICKTLFNYLKSEYSSVFSLLEEKHIIVKKLENEVEILLNLNSVVFSYYNNNNIEIEILKFLNKNFYSPFIIKAQEDKSQVLNENILKEKETEFYNSIKPEKVIERYEVFEPESIIGAIITPKPELIKNQTEERQSVILAGVISNLKEGTFISKRNKAKNSNQPSFYYSFTLTDHTGKIPAIYFSSKTTYPKFKKIKEGDSVLMLGNIKTGQRELSFNVKYISLCEISNTETENKIEQKAEILHIENYKTITPQTYFTNKQSNLFDKIISYPQDFLNKTYVVFDVETTGLRADRCELIEIGAVKIQNGRIVEQFQTLIQPEEEISEEITNITGITNEMVKLSPFAKDVIFDFYKFCEGAVIVGYNVTFDIAFINAASRKVNLKFSNEILDAMVIAKQKLYLPRYKLINVVESLGLKLDNAHRALADAIATAEVFLKLNEL